MIDDLSPYLKRWLNHGSFSASLQLAEFINCHFDDLAKHRHLRGEWLENPYRKNIEKWLLDPDLIEFMERAFEEYVDHPQSGRLAAAVDSLRWLAKGI